MSVKEEVNRAFQEAFKIIFGECNINIDELQDYLLRYHYPPIKRKSSVSGKDVTLSSNRYFKNSKIISQDEIADATLYKPLDINEIKDIDSIMEVLSNRFYYAGNKTFGNSRYIEGCDNCTDSFYVYNSCNVIGSKYVGYCSYVYEGSEYVFGSSYFLDSKYVIRLLSAEKIARSFETYISAKCSDMFFCYNCLGCMHNMFSFNLRSKRYCIGNLELPKEKYFAIRKKLVDESRGYIEKNKEFYSIFDFAPPSKELTTGINTPQKPQRRENLAPIDEAFNTACKVILGKKLGPVKEYAKFLSGRIDKVRKVRTSFGHEVYCSDYLFYKQIPKSRMASLAESMQLSKRHISINENEEVSLEGILKKISPLAFYTIDFHEGNNKNNYGAQVLYWATDTYKVCDATYSKKCAYCTLIVSSEAVFGSYRAVDSKFCIRIHDCINLTACMDMDCCKTCSYCLFCHNCENLRECMFCFNVKNLQYAIGNVVVGKEEYLRIKKIVLGEIVDKLEKGKKLDLDIYNAGCKGN